MIPALNRGDTKNKRVGTTRNLKKRQGCHVLCIDHNQRRYKHWKQPVDFLRIFKYLNYYRDD